MHAIASLGVAMHILAWLTGALYLSMALHFIYDFFAGVIYIRLARQSRAPRAAALHSPHF
jgi:membrane protease YdiL (CAAX protease family)